GSLHCLGQRLQGGNGDGVRGPFTGLGQRRRGLLGAAQAQAARYGGRAFDDVAAMLEAERVDAAWVCVAPAGHGAIERALVERGVPFFVEKPLSSGRATAEAIGAQVAASGLVTAVGYHWRAQDALPELRARLADGPPVAFLAGAWLTSTPAPAWWHRQATSGGQMVEQATHLLDLARHLIGEARVLHAVADRPPRPAHPDLDVASVSTAALRFASGALGTVTATCLLGASARVELQLMREGELVTVTQGSVTYDDGRERREVRVVGDPVAAEDRAFLDAVRAGDRAAVVCTYEDALSTHRLAHDVADAAA
ncbi:MAG: Gfo/Idh/MocA family oxidoreductase, partial [Trueperaceae bacterium]|nr:Gfo/Idh/MocA family oxidoreductase [Trueperaceae bacterium]